jgi:hypothetical protein
MLQRDHNGQQLNSAWGSVVSMFLLD